MFLFLPSPAHIANPLVNNLMKSSIFGANLKVEVNSHKHKPSHASTWRRHTFICPSFTRTSPHVYVEQTKISSRYAGSLINVWHVLINSSKFETRLNTSASPNLPNPLRGHINNTIIWKTHHENSNNSIITLQRLCLLMSTATKLPEEEKFDYLENLCLANV